MIKRNEPFARLISDMDAHSQNCKSQLETGHICYKCGRLMPACRMVRYDLPSAEGTGCDECYNG